MTKPFSLEELVARIHAVLRRTKDTEREPSTLEFADLTLDLDTHEVWRGREPVDLTATEFRLLRYLMLNPRRVLTRDRSSITCGITTSAATHGSSRRTSATCARRSTRSSRT